VSAIPFQPRPKILCIDDDPAITMAIRLRLARYEVDVLTAADGTDGIWMAMEEQPDVIITDLRMPNGDGDYVVECLKGRSDTGEIPVITLTGRRGNEAKCWMQTLGVKHYLHKPLQIKKLLAALEDYIEVRPACDDIKA
jgi:DNA-binding response OmpR family regulator